MSKAHDQAAAEVFFALGDGTRLSVVRKLSAGGALSATALSEGAHVTRQAIVKHLQSLDEAGLVAPSRAGREVRYALTPAPLEDAAGWMETVGADWDRRLARLRGKLEGGK